MQDEPRNSQLPDAASSLSITPAAAGPNPPGNPFMPSAEGSVGEPVASPAWAKDLRKLYNAVVEEPLPDSFIDLLSQLDSKD